MHSPRLLLGLLLGGSLARRQDGDEGAKVKGKWVVLLLTVGILLDLLISAALLYNNNQIRKATSETHIVRVAQYEACLASNQARAADLGRWEKVLTLLDTMPQNPQVQTFVAGVRAANAAADHPADCTSLVP